MVVLPQFSLRFFSRRWLIPDIYHNTHCPQCGKLHTLYYLSDIEPPLRATFSYTCPSTQRTAEVSFLRVVYVVADVPDDAIPMEWVMD
jgi:hypothetical protein